MKETRMHDHAIIIGASMAGLATSAALSSRFRRVTLFDRHIPREGESIAPHGRMPHVFLRGGFEALGRVLPGCLEDLEAAGAQIGTTRNGRWWSGGWRVRFDAPGIAPLASRALHEKVVRARVTALPNVRFVDDVAITGLSLERGRVRGVVHGEERTEAELVIDCSGRGSRLPEWLEAVGLPRPETTEVGVNLCYLAPVYERRPRDLDGDLYMVVQNMPPAQRLGIALAVENDRWMILLGGYFGDRPPRDAAGVVRFAESLPVPDLADLIRDRALIGEPASYRFASSRRVHFERIALPEGLVVLGDAMTSFNPIYGQGMSIATLQAERLGALLDTPRDPALLTRRAVRELARIADDAWGLATGADFSYSETTGRRPLSARFINGYIRRVFAACTVDPVVAQAMFDVQNMVAAPPSLMSPRIVARVLKH
jgi:2-polyprenyl-6-methoxyphenol hydroxylase-like FAD-dependent oxidoreductase